MIIFKIRQKLRNAGCKDASIEVVRGEGWYLNLEPNAVDEDEEALPEAAADRITS